MDDVDYDLLDPAVLGRFLLWGLGNLPMRWA